MRSDVKNPTDGEAELYKRVRGARFESPLTYLSDGVGDRGVVSARILTVVARDRYSSRVGQLCHRASGGSLEEILGKQ
jgi:hypothetical protein